MHSYEDQNKEFKKLLGECVKREIVVTFEAESVTPKTAISGSAAGITFDKRKEMLRVGHYLRK